jgi:hypothetical protein
MFGMQVKSQEKGWCNENVLYLKGEGGGGGGGGCMKKNIERMRCHEKFTMSLEISSALPWR